MNEQHGKFGKGRHFELVKKALIHAIDKYWETFGVILVETKLTEELNLDTRFSATGGSHL